MVTAPTFAGEAIVEFATNCAELNRADAFVMQWLQSNWRVGALQRARRNHGTEAHVVSALCSQDNPPQSLSLPPRSQRLRDQICSSPTNVPCICRLCPWYCPERRV